jgi:hypothetical protein
MLHYMGKTGLSRVALAIHDTRHALWIGALSFETRCVGSLAELHGANAKLHKGILLDYDTRVTPLREAASLRKDNLGVLKSFSEKTFVKDFRTTKLNPYVFDDLRLLLEHEFTEQHSDLLIVDLTCLTKIHALAAATFVAQTHKPSQRILLAYSVPENYGYVDESLEPDPAWRDVIIAPFGETAQLFNESSGQGIVVPGHESYRLIVAMAEIEPAGGIILLPEHRGRPDLRHLMVRRNQRLVQQLTRMQSRHWSQHRVPIAGSGLIKQHVSTVIAAAKEKRAPVILFPFGPKPIIYEISLLLAREYAEAAWFVYPVPVEYDVNYSFGIDQVMWFEDNVQ